MKQKMNKEDFNNILNAFKVNDQIKIHEGVRLVTGCLDSSYLSEIPGYMKKSLIRKVLRYTAQTALRGTFELDGLAQCDGFCEMEGGLPVSFGSPDSWSFWSDKLNCKVRVMICKDRSRIFFRKDFDNSYIEDMIIWPGLHYNTSSGRFDIVQYFEGCRIH